LETNIIRMARGRFLVPYKKFQLINPSAAAQLTPSQPKALPHSPPTGRNWTGG